MSPAAAPRLRAAVLGRPVAHSLSPVLHRAACAVLGLDVDYTEAGTPPEQLPLATAIATRRMVQEALTNALKHGDGRASLDVTWQDELVVIEVWSLFVPRAMAVTTMSSCGTSVAGAAEVSTGAAA